jgi:predicted tellurium resistance membrane protein TerC
MKENSVSSAGIQMRKEQVAIITLAVWLTVLSVSMLLVHSIDLGLFFILSLIGFFFIVEYISHSYVHPGYQRYIYYLLVAAIVLSGGIIIQKIMKILDTTLL